MGGIMELKPFISTDEACYDRIFAVNFKACANIGQVVAQSMIDRKSPGTIVNVSSVLSNRAQVNYSAYGASKGALDQLTRSMALELGPHGIRTNCVQPTLVVTNMTEVKKQYYGEKFVDQVFSNLEQKSPMRKIPEKRDIVKLIVHLLSDNSSMM